MTTWILCPNLRGARLFQCESIETGVRFIREFPHPKLHFSTDDFDSENDVPLELQDPELLKKKHHVAETFMKYLADQIEQASNDGRLDSLLVCAEPHMLRHLRHHLGRSTRKHLLGEVAVDLYDVNETDLVSYVQDFIERAERYRSTA